MPPNCNPCWNIVANVMPCASSSSPVASTASIIGSSISQCNNGITTIPLGTNANTGSRTITLTGINCNAGDLVIATIGVANNPNVGGTCTFNGTSMSPGGGVSVGLCAVRTGISVFYIKVNSPTVGGVITFTGTDTTAADFLGSLIIGTLVTGMPNGTIDNFTSSNGTTSSSPATPSINSSFANEFWLGSILQFSASSIALGSWINNFANGQTVSQIIAGGVISLNNGYNIVCNKSSSIAAKTGTSQDCFSILLSDFD